MGQSIAMHASPAARTFFLVLISTIVVHLPSFIFFSKSTPYFLTALLLDKVVSSVVWQNKIGNLNHSQRFKQVPVVTADEI